jgi:hypothetical protein
MRAEAIVFLAVSAVMAVLGLVYWFTSYEPSGTALLGFSVVLGLIPGLYLLRRSRTMASLASDRDDASIDDDAGVVGSFPEGSVWPFVLAGGAALTGGGLVFGLWSSLPGLVLLSLGFIGGSLESRGT